MQEETLENELCIASFYKGRLHAIDLISLDDLEYQKIYIPKGVYTTALLTPMQVH